MNTQELREALSDREDDLKFEYKSRMVAEDLNNVLATRIRELEGDMIALRQTSDDQLIATSDKLNARIALMNKALIPFADYATLEISPDEPDDQIVLGNRLASIQIFCKEFRVAARAVGYELDDPQS